MKSNEGMDNRSLLEWIPKQLDNICDYRIGYFLAFDIVWKTQELFENQIETQTLRGLYRMGLAQNLGETNHVRTLLLLLRKLESNLVVEHVKNCITILQDAGHSEDATIFQEVLDNFWSALEDEDTIILDDSEVYVKLGLKRARQGIIRELNSPRAKRRGLFDFSEIGENKVALSLSKVMNTFLAYFSKNLVCYTTIPLHEIVYFNDPEKAVNRVDLV